MALKSNEPIRARVYQVLQTTLAEHAQSLEWLEQKVTDLFTPDEADLIAREVCKRATVPEGATLWFVSRSLVSGVILVGFIHPSFEPVQPWCGIPVEDVR